MARETFPTGRRTAACTNLSHRSSRGVDSENEPVLNFEVNHPWVVDTLRATRIYATDHASVLRINLQVQLLHSQPLLQALQAPSGWKDVRQVLSLDAVTLLAELFQ